MNLLRYFQLFSTAVWLVVTIALFNHSAPWEMQAAALGVLAGMCSATFYEWMMHDYLSHGKTKKVMGKTKN